MALRCMDCKKIFPLPARISEEKIATAGFIPEKTRIVIETPCCPFCQSKNIEEVRIPIPEILDSERTLL